MEHILNQLMRQKILVGDGAMGSMLHQMDGSDCLEGINLTRPDLVLTVHLKYIAAGSDLIQTNSFSANRVKLARFGLQKKVLQINCWPDRRQSRLAPQEPPPRSALNESCLLSVDSYRLPSHASQGP